MADTQSIEREIPEWAQPYGRGYLDIYFRNLFSPEGKLARKPGHTGNGVDDYFWVSGDTQVDENGDITGPWRPAEPAPYPYSDRNTAGFSGNDITDFLHADDPNYTPSSILDAELSRNANLSGFYGMYGRGLQGRTGADDSYEKNLSNLALWDSMNQRQLSQDNLLRQKVGQDYVWDTAGRQAVESARDFPRMQMFKDLAQSGLLDQMSDSQGRGATQRSIMDQVLGRGAAETGDAYSDLATERGLWDAALGGTVNVATSGNPLIPAATSEILRTTRGDYLGGNPYNDALFAKAARPVVDQYRYATQPGIQAQFGKAGAYGGSASQQYEDMARFDLGQNLSELAAGLYGEDYGRERQNQLSTLGMVPEISGLRYQDVDKMAGAAEAARARGRESQNQGLSLANLMRQNALTDQSLAMELAERQRGNSLQDVDLWNRLGQQWRSESAADTGNLWNMASELGAGRQQDWRTLLGLGQTLQGNVQNRFDTRYQNQYARGNWPYELMERFGPAIGAGVGGGYVQQTTTPSPSFGNQAGTYIGAGIGLLGLGRAAFGG